MSCRPGDMHAVVTRTLAGRRRVSWSWLAAPLSVAAVLLLLLGCPPPAGAAVYAHLTVRVEKVTNPDSQYGIASGFCDGSRTAGCDVYFLVAVGSAKKTGASNPRDFNGNIGPFRQSGIYTNRRSFDPNWSTTYDITQAWNPSQTIYISCVIVRELPGCFVPHPYIRSRGQTHHFRLA